MKSLITLIIACYLFLPLPGLSQDAANGGPPFTIYIFPGYYTSKVRGYLLQNNCAEAHLLTYKGIDPDKDQQVDEDAIRKAAAEFYPGKDDGGLFIIDWEAQPFKDLREYDANDPRFKAAEAKYLQVVNTLKAFRPQLKVGIYGIPFRVLQAGQLKQSSTKLDRLLSRCDVITPSLYIMRTDEEVGQQRNLNYLKQNVDLALSFGSRLKKPVAPFVWYKVHPGNKRFGMNTISRDKMQEYLRFLNTYTYQGTRLNGIVWWEGGERIDKPATGNKRLNAAAAGAAPAEVEKARDRIIVDYTAPFLKARKQ
ncbi:hypothetical protein [uncultured Chitinophaga sp.]|jgi:hypothetical protein|uniref:hypothetical protein n=1 Tax=uncultured Chitinophaga sp. TaxID=339340 RepID=UPI00262DA103|nr:hypothetical protein [uncultured Chitinophaga sp.]